MENLEDIKNAKSIETISKQKLPFNIKEKIISAKDLFIISAV
jgi:hypothetical protein